MGEHKDTHIFDDVFRTMEEHTPELMIPLINEVFKTTYPEDAAIGRMGDKHHLLQKLMETDSCISIGNKIYHYECESNPNHSIISIRMFQYDVTVALGKKKKEDGVYVVEFPSSCVIYLRHNRNTGDNERVIVRMPDGRQMDYIVPVLKSQEYTKNEIFEKKLYILLPYYILKYEKQLSAIEKEEEKRRQLLDEYEDICRRLEDALGKENPLAYSELHKLMVRVLNYILKEQKETRKGVQQIMGGHVLESFRDEMLRKGHAEGREEGREEGRAEGRKEERQENYRKLVDKVMAKMEKGKSVTQIADELEEPVSVIQPIYDELLKEEK